MKSKEDHRWFPVFVLKVNKKLAFLSVKEDDYSLNQNRTTVMQDNNY